MNNQFVNQEFDLSIGEPDQRQPKSNKAILVIVLIIATIIIVAGGIYFFKKIDNLGILLGQNTYTQNKDRMIDSDNDGILDQTEEIYGTNQNMADTDDDGFTDYEEINNGYNPTGEGGLDKRFIEIRDKNSLPVPIDFLIQNDTWLYSHETYQYEIPVTSGWLYYGDYGDASGFLYLKDDKYIRVGIMFVPTSAYSQYLGKEHLDKVSKKEAIKFFDTIVGITDANVHRESYRLAGSGGYKYIFSDGGLSYLTAVSVKTKYTENFEHSNNQILHITAESRKGQNDVENTKIIERFIKGFNIINVQSNTIKRYSGKKEEQNFEYCYSLDFILYRDRCFNDLALKYKDRGLCNNILALEDREKCHVEINNTNKDPEVCKRLYDKTKCYTALAVAEGNPYYCTEIEKADFVSSCYFNLAVKILDESLCEKIVYEKAYNRYNTLEECYRRIAKAKNDKNICNLIKEEIYRNGCIRSIK